MKLATFRLIAKKSNFEQNKLIFSFKLTFIASYNQHHNLGNAIISTNLSNSGNHYTVIALWLINMRKLLLMLEHPILEHAFNIH